jgi:hypothetical protein
MGCIQTPIPPSGYPRFSKHLTLSSMNQYSGSLSKASYDSRLNEINDTAGVRLEAAQELLDHGASMNAMHSFSALA